VWGSQLELLALHPITEQFGSVPNGPGEVAVMLKFPAIGQDLDATMHGFPGTGDMPAGDTVGYPDIGDKIYSL
jgi:hypothetical protein